MRTTLSAIRTFVMAFLILAGSLGAVFASPAQEAAAAGPCDVAAAVRSFVSNGYTYVFGLGAAFCNYTVSQAIVVQLFANGTLVQKASNSGTVTNLASSTNGVLGKCGVRYRVAVTHAVSGYSTTTTWNPGFYLC